MIPFGTFLSIAEAFYGKKESYLSACVARYSTHAPVESQAVPTQCHLSFAVIAAGAEALVLGIASCTAE